MEIPYLFQLIPAYDKRVRLHYKDIFGVRIFTILILLSMQNELRVDKVIVIFH